MNLKPIIAEGVATFMLVLAGCGAIVVNDAEGGVITHVGIALTFGLIVMTMIYAVGETSGAHLNPAVTIAFWVARRLPGRSVPGYIAAQCLGAIAAAALLKLLYPDHATLGATVADATVWKSFVVEVVITCMLMYVILSVATGAQEKGMMAGVAIGGTVALNALWAGPLCGASMNPARSLGPALLSGQLSTLWVYLIAPILGAALAVVLCRLSHAPGACCAPSTGCEPGKC
ncbi:MAG: MIP family channel protein [Phycisphaera sp.]|nr:MIP family channel protein [Phycisphaera sp.]